MDDHVELFPMPTQIAVTLRKFLSERRTGNITLNIKNGRILGLHVVDINSVDSKEDSKQFARRTGT